MTGKKSLVAGSCPQNRVPPAEAARLSSKVSKARP